ncbi:thiamine phosphate synthase [Algicella marina]|uniref:Thiamine phosphate synthase n=1 Tax=Algicella marina TaxID=2683284 RepID=A0A6P1SZY2_9RHOB|nr:thiamine phosphate synthase [Algicella marina]QHQ35317.1 thiamine phosphate synthase [Algicella marina]
MADADRPQIYLITPARFELSRFEAELGRVLDGVEIACVRLAMETREADEIARAADVLREVAHKRDVPLVIDAHWKLVETLGLDGVHLGDGARQVREVRKALDSEAVVGAFCGSSRHAGMTAGEIGADYISFGPVTADPMLGDGEVAAHETFAWWSEMIELPVVAEGGLTPELARTLAPVVDFFALGAEVWETDDALAALKGYAEL